MNTSISLATPESVGSWLPLFAAYLAFYQVDQPPQQCLDFISERLRRRQAAAFVAKRGDTPQGFALMYTSYSSLTLQPCWLLHDLYVSTDARSQGLGRSLLNRCQQFVVERGGGQIMLQTAHHNLLAQQLYESAGFELDTAFRVYYWQAPPA